MGLPRARSPPACAPRATRLYGLQSLSTIPIVGPPVSAASFAASLFTGKDRITTASGSLSERRVTFALVRVPGTHRFVTKYSPHARAPSRMHCPAPPER